MTMRGVDRRSVLEVFAATAGLIGAGAANAAQGAGTATAPAEGKAGATALTSVSWRGLRPQDEAFRRRFVDPYLPDKVFDAHVHIHAHDNWLPGTYPEFMAESPDVVDIALYRKLTGEIIPGERLVGGAIFGLPFGVDVTRSNAYVASELKRAHPGFTAFGQMLTRPEMDPEFIRQEVRRNGFIGLKPYFLMARRTDQEQARIEEYLPDAHVRVAHEEHLLIMLHVVRTDAIADADNIATLQRYSRVYPDARIVLAHAGATESALKTVEAVDRMGKLPNIWWDSSICSSGVMEVVISRMGHDRLLFATDFYASQIRGLFLALGGDNHYVGNPPPRAAGEPTSAPVRATLVGLESLANLLLATRILRLSDTQVEDIFHNNAVNLINGRN